NGHSLKKLVELLVVTLHLKGSGGLWSTAGNRQKIQDISFKQKKDVYEIQKLLQDNVHKNVQKVDEDGVNILDERVPLKLDKQIVCSFSLNPIGFMKSAFVQKSGTPRQGCLASDSNGSIRISSDTFNNPHHSLEGLDQYSHVWLLFIFHDNGKGFTKAKVSPPRLCGDKLGVFATRSPHRPNPIGLTLAKLNSVVGDTVHVSGVDLLDGTPILDIKPFIPAYDNPVSHDDSSLRVLARTGSSCSGEQAIARKKIEPKCNELNENSSLNTKNLVELSQENLIADYDGKSSVSSELTNPLLLHTSPVDEAKLKSEKIFKLHQSSKRLVQEDFECNSCVPETLTIPDSDLKASNKVPYDSKSTCTTVALSSSQQMKNAALMGQVLQELEDQTQVCVRTAQWLQDAQQRSLNVVVNPVAEKQLLRFSSNAEKEEFRLKFTKDSSGLRNLIVSSVGSDVRSHYRRAHCPDLLYHYCVDCVRVTAVFLGDDQVEILRVTPIRLDLPP
ncbi:tRNA (adenine(37)-N6)-methyltransferase, partial [Hyalella azteca]|uniref:tRNA (Adenine(37)-N6)-methyltransferase n=1 Tax=Hyalella azteca TaxID=294128 RepID=A0A8B7N5V5_HYAAZ